MPLMILLPYDRGYPHFLWCDGKTAVISARTASALRPFGIGLSSEYTLENGQPVNPRLTYPSSKLLDLDAARTAADAGVFKISKKARSLLDVFE